MLDRTATHGYTTGTRKVWRKLMPILLVAFILNTLDRTNIGMAKTHLDADLGISAAAFGFGAGLFFLAYCTMEIPSNLMLHRIGARVWISRIVITWGTVSTLTMFVWNDTSFYVMRFLLGLAEAGFYPGMLFYITLWFAPRDRPVAVGALLIAPQLALIFGSPLAGTLMQLDGLAGLDGWRWMLLLEGLPTVIFGFFLLRLLPNGPQDARWLTSSERTAIIAATDGVDTNEHSVTAALKAVFSNGILLAIAAIYFASQLAVWGVVFFLPSIVEGFGIENSVAIGAIAGLPSIGALIGVLLYPRLFRRYTRPILFTAAALVGGAISGYIGAYAGPVPALIAFAVLQSLAVGIGPILWSTAMGTITGRTAAAGLAMINSIGLLGGFFGPTIFGLVETASGSAREAGVIVTYTFVAALVLATPPLAWLLRRVSTEPKPPTVPLPNTSTVPH
ncbi:MFS transporter [Nocardia sp. NPDC057663]|uniref:MFS transporter n=1 Tax=Nocardia sp. NPDC057663 TaxID=3346201 RepID=UPI003671BE5A